MKSVLALLTAPFLFLVGCATHVPPKETPLTAAEAKAQETREFAAAMTSAKDAETQRLLVFAWALRGNNNNNSQSVMQHNGATFWDFANETRRDLVSVVPSILSYKGAVRASESSERINESNARVSIANSNNFLALGVAGISGSSAIGTALAIRPSPAVTPTTQITVSGNSGAVNLGNGTQNSNSFNPVNPSPVVCLPGTSTTAGSCSR